MNDSYLTIQTEAAIELKVKSSRFIAETCLVTTVDDATSRLRGICKREHAATHHCYAYRIGHDDHAVFKYSDDGEPAGTAGRPIYDCLVGIGLTDLLLVVTRYFGGTKLGTGGLTHAYAAAAKQVLEKSGAREQFITTRLKLHVNVRRYESVKGLLERVGVRVVRTDFSDSVIVELDVRQSQVDALTAQFLDVTAGKGKIETNA